MDNTMMMEDDPLSAYAAQYDYSMQNQYYPQPQMSQAVPQAPAPYMYPNEQPQNYPESYQPELPPPTSQTNYPQEMPEETAENNEQTTHENEEVDIKPDIAELEASLNKIIRKTAPSRRPKGRTSSYWNKRIEDKDFKFYGCSICNVAYKDIKELDKHVVIHSNRITSYEVRMINMKRRKQFKKEQKKKKKEAKVKKETEIEIKPEDGYIGTDKATDVKPKPEVKKSEPVVARTARGAIKNGFDPMSIKSQNEKKYVHVYKCFGCDKLFALSYYLRLHVRSHTQERPYKCQDCGQGFITASRLGRHRKRTHLATRHQCRICYRIFSRFELLVKHFDMRHAAEKLDGEPYDYNAILPYIKELEEQLKLDKEKKPKTEDPWQVPQTDENTAQREFTVEIAKEEMFVTKEEDKIKIPEYMEFYNENTDEPTTEFTEEIKTKIDIEIKTERHSDDDDGIDDRGDDNDADDHKLQDNGVKNEENGSDEDHLPIKTWARPHSPKAQTRKRKRETKDTSGTKKRIRPLCPVCNKYINRKISLTDHLKAHAGQKPYPCATCSRKYKSAAALKRHVLQRHNDTKDDVKHEELKIELEVNSPKNEKESNDQEEATVKDDPPSEEDYFPSQTWVECPSPLPDQPFPPQTKGRETTCTVCNKKLCSKTYLNIHMRTHTGEKPYSCYICKRGFITASKMHRHVLTHDESWEGKEKIKAEKESLDKSETENEDHEDNKALIDIAKSKMLLKKSKKSFFEKKERTNKKWTHACEFCNKKFLHLETLQVHRKTHDESESMKCYYCLEQFSDSETLKAHIDSHAGPKPYQCSQCKRPFVKRATMIYHRRKCKPDSVIEAGLGARKYLCELCHKSYNNQAKLKRHLATHSISHTLRFECPVCAHMFHTKWHVQMHLRSHMKEGLIQEENRNAVLAMVLQNARKIPKPTPELTTTAEIPDAQPDERSRICNICGEIFQHFFFLEEHLKTHASKLALDDLEEEEEKKHVCQVCSKSFKLAYYLKLHSYTHTKEKPYICQQCGKGFITKGKLKRHLETHQGLKKYQCHICYKFFTRPSYLRIHVRTIHGTQDYNFRDYGIGVPIGALPQE